MGTQVGGISKFVRKRGKVRGLKFTMKSSGCSSVKRRISVKKGELNHHYDPCGCKSACGKDCVCLLNKTHCEKYCGCPRSVKIDLEVVIVLKISVELDNARVLLQIEIVLSVVVMALVELLPKKINVITI